MHIHPSIHCLYPLYPFYGVAGGFAGVNPSCFWGSRQLIAGLSIWGSVSCSWTLRHAAQFRRTGIWTSNLPFTSWPALPTQLQPPRPCTYVARFKSDPSNSCRDISPKKKIHPLGTKNTWTHCHRKASDSCSDSSGPTFVSPHACCWRGSMWHHRSRMLETAASRDPERLRWNQATPSPDRFRGNVCQHESLNMSL